MTEGRHYWEVEFNSYGGGAGEEAIKPFFQLGNVVVAVGAIRPGQATTRETSNPAAPALFLIVSDSGNLTIRKMQRGL
jgi:hypothetical protein